MKRQVFLLPAVLLVLGSSIFAQRNQQNQQQQNEPVDREQNHKFWQASVGGGSYMVALSKITSISRHEYVINGNVVVDEVTVDTSGRSLARFYFIRPLTEEMGGTSVGATAGRLAGRAQQLIDRGSQVAGTNVADRVIKTYPDTTHAGSVEFRVHSAGTLSALYGSVRTAWMRGKGRSFSE